MPPEPVFVSIDPLYRADKPVTEKRREDGKPDEHEDESNFMLTHGPRRRYLFPLGVIYRASEPASANSTDTSVQRRV